MVRLRRYLHRLIALLLIVFISQSATVMALPCQLLSDTPATSYFIAELDHSTLMAHDMSHHNMTHSRKPHHDTAQTHASHNAPTANSTQTCCNLEGHCLFSSCSVPILSGSVVTELEWMLEHNPITDLYILKTPKSPIPSLYRPPIFR